MKGIYTFKHFKGQLKGARGNKGSSRVTVAVREQLSAVVQAPHQVAFTLQPRGASPGPRGLSTSSGSQLLFPLPASPFQTLFSNFGPPCARRFRLQACAGTSSQLASFPAGCRPDILRQAWSQEQGLLTLRTHMRARLLADFPIVLMLSVLYFFIDHDF